ncbi:MAG: hypothetical protein MJK04_28150, partial [Psychrosphaera sp.]|nr:hypothetical protein [Psychrosphaera sp.]
LLHNTNVFSLCEDVGKGQVGNKRVTQKMLKLSPKGHFNNFFVIKNSLILTKRGQLAAIQLKRNPLAEHTTHYSKFSETIKQLKNQLMMLNLEDVDGEIESFGDTLLDHEYEIQSDTEDVSDDVFDIYITKDGTKLKQQYSNSTEFKPSDFKKLKKVSDKRYQSKTGSDYSEMDDVRILKGKSPTSTVSRSKQKWVKKLISNNSEENKLKRNAVAQLILSNLMTITETVEQCISNVDTPKLYEVLYNHLTLLNQNLTLDDDKSPLTIKPKPVLKRRQSKKYRTGFLLNQLELMTDIEQVKYLQEIEDELSSSDDDTEDTEDTDDCISSLFNHEDDSEY